MKIKNKGGRPAYQATAKDRNAVLVLSGAGLDQEKIALVVGCDAKTLRKHYGEEIKVGAAKLEAMCVQTIAQCLQAGGSTGLRAAHMLVTMRFGWSQYAPPQSQRAALGKKEQLNLAAENGHTDTSWGDLVH
jgi:hypothetical protein